MSASDCHGVMVTTESDFQCTGQWGSVWSVSTGQVSTVTTHPGSFSANISCHCGHQGADKYAVSAVRGNYGHNDQPRVLMSVTSLMSLYSGSQWAGCGGCRPLIGQSRASDWLVSVSVYSGWMGWTDNPSHYRPLSRLGLQNSETRSQIF